MPALRAAATPRFGSSSTRQANGSANPLTIWALSSRLPSSATTTSNPSGGAVWRASACSNARSISRRW
jgi:hypothetical protein